MESDHRFIPGPELKNVTTCKHDGNDDKATISAENFKALKQGLVVVF